MEKTVDLIFNKPWMCSLQYLASLTDDELDFFGIHYVGDKEFDEDTQNQLIDKYLTINDMVELMRRGVDFRIRYHEDTKKIYDIITEHIRQFTTAQSNGRRLSETLTKDLTDLDKLAELIFPHVRGRLNKEPVNFSPMVESLAGATLFPTAGIMQTRKDNNDRRTINDAVRTEEEISAHQSLLEDIEKRSNHYFVPTFNSNGEQ